jgi:hypothetical protein
MILKKSLPVMRYGVEKLKYCFSIFPKIMKGTVMKFSWIIEFSIVVWVRGMGMSAVTSGHHRKWKNKSEFSELIFQIKNYSILLGLFSNFQNSWPQRKLKRQIPVISKTCFKFSIFNALNLLYYESVSLVINIYCTHQKCLEQRRIILKKLLPVMRYGVEILKYCFFHFL